MNANNHRYVQQLLAGAVIALSVLSAPAAVEQDILLSYAPSYASSMGGEANTQVYLASQVAAVNHIYDQSGAGAHWHVAGYYQSINDPVNWTTTGGMVGWLSSDNANVADVVSYANSVGADLVLYIVQNSDSSSIAGVTQQPGRYGSINPSAVWSAVMAHEIGGHAYGCNHQDGKLNPKTIMMHNYCGGGAAPPYFFSNPNIWWNGVNMLGDGQYSCLGGSAINGDDNTYCLSANAQGVSGRNSRVVYAPVLNKMIYHWSFTNAPGSAPAGTTNYDLISGAPAVVRGNGATYTGSALRLPGGTTGNVAMNSMSAYIDLPNGILSSQTNITIEIWATPLSAQNWARIMDFGNSSVGELAGNPGDLAPGNTSQTDGITLTACIGTDITKQRFEARHNSSVYTLDTALATTPGVQHCYTITFTDGAGAYGANGGRWEWYRDGYSVGFLDVSNHLSSIQDVNEWLGRSEWSADSLANNDYSEVRISNVAMNQWQVMANYLLGPNYVPDVMLTAGDALGSTSFNAAGNWSSGAAPTAGHKYDTDNFMLRTPATASAYMFAGDALAISGGSLLWKGTSSSGTITVNNLTVNNGDLQNAGSGTFNLAGNLAISNNVTCNSINGPTTISANLSGNGSLTFYANTASITGNNANFTGKIRVGNGIVGGLNLSSEAQLGANPPTFTPDQLILNRGWLYTTTSFAINDSNRGILIGVNDGIFDESAGTTLTLGCPLASGMTITSDNQLTTQAEQSGVVAGGIIKQNSGTLALASSNPNYNGWIAINGGTLSLVGTGQLGGGNFGNPITDNGVFNFNSAANQTISSVIAGSGSITKNGSGLLTLSGSSTFTGSTTVNAGTLSLASGGAGGALSGTLNINSGGTVQLNATDALGWGAGTSVTNININGGTLNNNVSGNNSYLASWTLTGGTMTSSGGGTFHINAGNGNEISSQASAKTSSITGQVAIRGANAILSIGVADGVAATDLLISGAIANSPYEAGDNGIAKSGTGTLVLSGANSYTGTTTVNAGTLLVNGSIGSGSVTVASGATLGGNGTVGGTVTVQSGGTLSPGSSIGKLTVNSSVTLRAGSTTVMEINKTAQTNDQLLVSGALTYDGTLVVSNLSGTLAAGDSFKLFQAGSINGSFSSNSLPALSAGLAWNTSNLSAGVLSVVSITPTNLVWTVNGTNLNLSWPAGYKGWRLQSNTNLTGTNWVDVPGSSLTNDMILPVDAIKGSVFYRLTY